MKRILVATFLLLSSILISLFGTKTLLVELEKIEEQTLSVMKNESSAVELLDSWSVSEKKFSLLLNNSKFNKLKTHISDLQYISDGEFDFCCNQILCEIEEIRQSQLFLIENIL